MAALFVFIFMPSLVRFVTVSSTVTPDVEPFCSSTCSFLTYSTADRVCVGVEGSDVFCYGYSTGCMWGSNQCNNDGDCVAYKTFPKYNAGTCDGRVISPTLPGDDWPWCGCEIARQRYTAPPTTIPTVNPSAVPSIIPTLSPTAAATEPPTVQPSAGPTADPTATPSASPTQAPSASPTITPSASPSETPTTGPTPMPSASPTATPSADPTTAPSQNQYIAKIRTSPSYGETRNGFSFAAYTPTGAMQAWGGGKDMKITTVAGSGVESIAANRASFVALLADGTVEGHGTAAYMKGYETYQTGAPLVSLVANDGAYAGVDDTGAAIAFGGSGNGNSIIDSGFSTQLTTGVAAVIPSAGSFTALMLDGTVFTWGNKYCGGGVSSLTRTDLVGITQVVATKTAFAGLTAAGGIVTWGDQYGGGDFSAVAAQLQSDVIHIISTQSAFVAFKRDNSLVIWGNPRFGADASTVAADLTSGIVHVAHTSSAFAALKADGSVVVWGRATSGGDASAVQSELHDMTTILGNHYAFAAIRADGSVVAWGNFAEGGAIPSPLATSLSAGVTALFATRRAFAALKGATGELVVWGNPYHGGDAGVAAAHLSSGVRTVCSNDAAFTAILQDGRAAAWGHATSVAAPGLLLDSAGAVFTAFTVSAQCV